MDAVKVSSSGPDPADATEYLQKALDSGGRRIVIGKAGSPYKVRPLFVRSNTEVVFEEGVEFLAKEGGFHDLFDALVTLHGVTNVTLRGLGKGATLKMRIKDYQGPAYSHGEWRHAINLLSVSGVTIENLTLADSGGDGIYVGTRPSSVPCRNVVIRDCVCDNNNRQGISVISADGLLIERTVMKNTRGTAPRSGIDFEPNHYWQVLKNIVMRECLTENNEGCGYELYAGKFTRASEPVDITLEHCRSSGDRLGAFKVSFDDSGWEDGPCGGRITVRNCTFSKCRSPSVLLQNKPAGVADILMENCLIERGENLAPRIPDVKFAVSGFRQPPTDGIEFRNVTLRRPDSAGWFETRVMPWSSAGIDGVKGTVKIEMPDGKAETVMLDDVWRRTFSPVEKGVKYVLDDVPFNPAKIGRIVDEKPSERVALSPMVMRFALDALVYAAKPGPVTFTARLVKVNSRKIKDGRFTVKDMAGRTVATLPAVAEKAEVRSFTASAAGFYRIACDMKPHGLVFETCDAPIGFMPIPKYSLDVYKSQGNLYFTHAAGADETFFCGGTGEAATITLFDPSGAEVAVWRNQMDWGFRRIAPDAAEGLWRVNIAHPDKEYRWEDSCYDRTGAAPVFFLSMEKYWISTK